LNILYISPSIIPSRSANSIHVTSMCQELAILGHNVSLIAATRLNNRFDANSSLKEFYGADSINLTLVAKKIINPRGIEFFISLLALYVYIKLCISKNTPNLIISRNLYSAFLFSCVLRKKIIYETHSPESGIRMKFQKMVLRSNKVKAVVISEALKIIMISKYDISNSRITVLHDAAKSFQKRASHTQRKNKQHNLLSSKVDLSSFDKVIGYFGHLYSGRGIEIIEGLAKIHKKHAFIVYGGNKEEISYYQQKNTSNNLFFMGHVSPKKASILMLAMDILLMPYQESVSIGIDSIDTVKWMSPMKMFEYMACGVPIISSDLSVLKEVLIDNHNSLLVKPNDIEDWALAIQRISNSSDLQEMLGKNAFYDYREKHTWNIRAKAFIKLNANVV